MIKIFYNVFANTEIKIYCDFLKLCHFNSFDHISNPNNFVLKTFIKIKRGLFMYLLFCVFLYCTVKLEVANKKPPYGWIFDVTLSMIPQQI